MTTAAFDTVMGRLDSPLIVVTTGSADQQAGCVVGFHTQCSIDPVRYAVWVSKANQTYRVALFATHLALHFLDVGDHELAELFGGTTGDDVDKFARCEWQAGPGGVPLLTRCPTRVVIERTSLWDDGSDHVCIVGEPVDASAAPGFTPLRLADAHDITAGHAAQERPTTSATPAEGRTEEIATIDDGSRHELEAFAAGAGHAIDLGDLDPEAGP